MAKWLNFNRAYVVSVKTQSHNTVTAFLNFIQQIRCTVQMCSWKHGVTQVLINYSIIGFQISCPLFSSAYTLHCHRRSLTYAY